MLKPDNPPPTLPAEWVMILAIVILLLAALWLIVWAVVCLLTELF
jgi:hypothetical protein